MLEGIQIYGEYISLGYWVFKTADTLIFMKLCSFKLRDATHR